MDQAGVVGWIVVHLHNLNETRSHPTVVYQIEHLRTRKTERSLPLQQPKIHPKYSKLSANPNHSNKRIEKWAVGFWMYTRCRLKIVMVESMEVFEESEIGIRTFVLILALVLVGAFRF